MRLLLVAGLAFLLSGCTASLPDVAPSQRAPTIGFTFNDETRIATVFSAPSGSDVRWGSAIYPGLIASCSAGTADAEQGGANVKPGTTVVTVGDTISGCSPGATLTVRDSVSNAIVTSHRFP